MSAEVTRCFDLPDFYLRHFGDKEDVFASKVNGQWEKWSMKKFVEISEALASGMINEGLKKGDRVAILSNNRPEWNAVDFATQISGAVLIPIYPTISENDLKFIFGDSEPKFIFVSNSSILEKAKAVTSDLASPPKIYSINGIDASLHYSSLVESGKKTPQTELINKTKAEITPMDLLTILYTSGTTGTPKGVMLSHNNLVSNFTSLCDLPPVDHTHRALSFLPLNHIYERMLVYLYLFRGPAIYYAESIDTIAQNMQELQPHIFSCVPQLIQKVYNRITSKGLELTGFKRKLFFWSVALGEKFEIRGKKNGWWYNIKLAIANKLVFSKWRAGLGGNVRAMISGGAALDPRLARIFWAAKMPVLEGYGLTETSPVIAVNNFNPDSVCFGTVGPVIKDVTVKFAADGEILVKGPNVMMGYYKRPDATAEVIDAEGYFHTGDIGTMVENRFLKITDRKKEIFKTSGGKYIAPQMIENLLKSSKFVEQSMVIGENRKYPSAIIVPSFAFLKDWAKLKGYDIGSTHEEMVKNQKVMDRIMSAVNKINANLAQYEKIKKIILLPNEWTVNSGELTPKLSLKRKVILAENTKAIDDLYRE
ncbi:MAG TPA: long-chain fatty acid--CoA ligase [Bacteroidia bacterium]|jgi:long-chain acyl-CoA synthetase|nr:long-chain fatty acid--CoA ligase [Bacteroidia bacterium]